LYRLAIKDLIPTTILWGKHKNESVRWAELIKFFNELNKLILEQNTYKEKLKNSKYLKFEKIKEYKEDLQHLYISTVLFTS
jgi:hypothetical protein